MVGDAAKVNGYYRPVPVDKAARLVGSQWRYVYEKCDDSKFQVWGSCSELEIIEMFVEKQEFGLDFRR